ncbi:hypothetical protein AVEN_98978-1 [Araneus ventricosus]|uniref:Uncharacterized protein n=1 Tax=Araneus ventricosus TaxID=182803 RepID=A0A4Y2G6P1_ARAVE|nr:hypothetical protein AVEN_98978-1 [Araneus ventricosus]
MGRHARPTRGGNLLSMRSKKHTEWQQLLMESSLAYPRGKEEKEKLYLTLFIMKRASPKPTISGASCKETISAHQG